MNQKQTTTLIILDGFGHREETENNAIALAHTPHIDRLREGPSGLISGSGLDVGLPAGQMGNSEVGHMNLGAGRVVHQDFTRINQAIADGSINQNNALLAAINATDNTVHILGMLSDGGVHSHQDQLFALIDLADQQNASRIVVHAFLDGRDVPPQSAAESLKALSDHIGARDHIRLGSVCGRFYAMDRDQRWNRVQKAYKLLTEGKASFRYPDGLTALEAAYDRGETDEFVEPTIIGGSSEAPAIKSGDSVIFANFRADRAREITEAIALDVFDGFERESRPRLAQFICLTEYSKQFGLPVAFPPERPRNGLGEYLASNEKTQLRIAETEKYAHVTFFFSCGEETPFPGEDRKLIPSPDVKTYDMQPSMSAPEVTRQLTSAIRSGQYDFIVCNYANGDMVGHTGNLDAAIEAVECLDQCLGEVVQAIQDSKGQALITADHGNCESMLDMDSGQPHTAHTSELVPLFYVGDQDVMIREGGVLSDIAPTLLHLMDLCSPAEMTGQNLLAPASTVHAAS